MKRPRPRGCLGVPIALCVLGIVALPGCGPSYPPSSEGHYLAKCSRCHEADGSSVTARKQAKKDDIDLRDPVLQRSLSDDEIRQIMRYGTGRMQGVSGLTEAIMDSILLHVRRLPILRKAATSS